MNPRYPKPPGCSGCSLEHAGFGFAPPSGPPTARLQFLGESLGYEEAIHGEPFYGAAGGTLTRILMRAGVDRRQTRIGNVVSCRPPGDYLVGAPYEEHAIVSCRQYLQPFLDQIPDNGVLVPLGMTAAAAALNLRGQPGFTVKDLHSTVWRSVDDRYWVVPTFHPSFLQRGAMNHLEVVTQDVQLADRISQRGFVRSPVELVVDPHPDWFVRWVDEHLAMVVADPEGVHLSIDTEFQEKSGGADESEVVLNDVRSPLTRINGANSASLGWTVPAREPYLSIARRLCEGVSAAGGWTWMWNKYADLDHVWALGWAVENATVIDGMWAWHYLQSDLPRGLGFVAPMASDFGAWKHWAKIAAREGEYAAADGVQNWRTCMWILKALYKQGIWDLFLTDWHERDVWALRPAFVQGVPANRTALEQFHAELQVKLANVLVRIKETAARGVLKPKLGYAKRPKDKPCPACAHAVDSVTISDCLTCRGRGRVSTPPASIIGKPRKAAAGIGGEAKSAYLTEGVRLVERAVEVEVRCCETCGATDVGTKHRCPVQRPKRTARKRKDNVEAVERTLAESPDQPSTRPVPVLVIRRAARTRYFWQLPFNPDAPAQVLAYLADRGIDAPIDKKKGRATTAKKELERLQKLHSDDPFFQLQLDWKAVQKVDSTYAVGALARLDKDDMLHPEITPAPSTFRDASRNPNIQNVVADKAGPAGLASGFRRCIVARDGIPVNRTEAEIAAWMEKWGS